MRRALLSAAIALSLTGGAALQADGTRATEGLLTDTPEKAAHLAELTQGKIVRRDQDGRASYLYADGSVCHFSTRARTSSTRNTAGSRDSKPWPTRTRSSRTRLPIRHAGVSGDSETPVPRGASQGHERDR